MRYLNLSFLLLLPVLASAQVRSLSFQPIGAEYSSTLDRIVFVSASPNQLHIYDPVGPSIQTLDLPAAPTALSVLGNRAAVRHNDSITLVNLAPLSVATTFAGTPTNPTQQRGLLLTPEWIHVGGRASIRISNGATTLVSGGSELTRVAGLPDNTAFYGRDPDTGSTYRYNISTGPITGRTQVPSFSALDFTIGKATGRLYASNGRVYTPTPSSLDYFGDMSKNFSQDFGFQYVESPVGSFAAGIQSADLSVGIYERSFYGTVHTQTTSAGSARAVFFDNSGTRLYILVSNGTSYSVEVSNWASTTNCTPTFDSPPSSIHRDGGVYRNSISAPSDCRYTVQSNAGWIQMVTGAHAGGNAANTFFAFPNRTGSSRTATITAGNQTMTVTQEAVSSDPGHKFGFTTFDPAYRKANDTLLLTSPDLNFLLVYDPATRQYGMENLPRFGTAVALQPGGDYAAIGHPGFVSIVRLNPNAPPAPAVLNVPLRADGVVLPGNGYLYAYGINDDRGMYWRNLNNSQSGFVAGSGATGYAPMTLVPARNAIYWQGAKWDISNGVPVRYARATACPTLWANEAGTRTYGCGKAYIASDVITEDGLDAGTISLGWVDYSSAQQAVAVLNDTDRQIHVWNDSPLSLRGSVAVPTVAANQVTSRGSRVFWSSTGAKLYAMLLEPATNAISGEGIVEVTPPANCTYTLASNAISAPYTGYSGQVGITTQTGCQWTATLSGGDWSSLTGASGTGNGAVSVNVTANPYGTPRRVAIQIGSASVVITQAANPGTITVTPQVLDVPATASTQSLTITTSTPSRAWRVQISSAFFSWGSGFGFGSTQLPLNIEANTGPARSISFLIGDVPVIVRQAAGNGGAIAFTSNGAVLPGKGGTAQLNIAATGSWTATSSQDWLRIVSSASGNGNGSITVTAPLNPSPAFRSATVNAGGATAIVVQSGQQPLEFYPLTPCRIADTRNAPGPLGQPVVAAQTERTFPVLSSPCGVPAEAVAYSMNVTVVPQGQLGYLTIYPAGETRPVVSLLNSLDGRIKANSTILRAGANGGVTVFVTGTTHVVLDINGYFAPPKEQSLAFRPVTPCRIVDTRNTNGPRGGPSLAAGVARTIAISGVCSIPASAKAFALNITAIPRSTLGYITVWPTGQAQPTVSTLNAVTGTITANAAVTPAGAGGAIDVFANNDTDLLVDINGYFDSAVEGTSYFSYYTMDPCRIADTRFAPNTPSMAAGEERIFGGTQCGIPIPAVNLTLNATVIPSGSFGYLTLWDPFQPMPLVSTLNAVDGALTSNSAFVPTGVIPPIFRAFTSSPADLLFDVTGYFSTTPVN